MPMLAECVSLVLCRSMFYVETSVAERKEKGDLSDQAGDGCGLVVLHFDFLIFFMAGFQWKHSTSKLEINVIQINVHMRERQLQVDYGVMSVKAPSRKGRKKHTHKRTRVSRSSAALGEVPVMGNKHSRCMFQGI